jgi:hypothetical protein
MLESRSCRNHPARPGIGSCPSCSAVICEECSTRVDGILHCRECLARAAAGDRRRSWRSWSAVIPTLSLVPVAYLAVAYALQGLVTILALLASRWGKA